MGENWGAIIGVIGPTILVTAIIIILLRYQKSGRSSGVVQLSHVQCPKCGREFDYEWIPMASFTAIRLFHSRFFACPICGNFASFNVWDTRVDPNTHYCGNIQIGPS